MLLHTIVNCTRFKKIIQQHSQYTAYPPRPHPKLKTGKKWNEIRICSRLQNALRDVRTLTYTVPEYEMLRDEYKAQEAQNNFGIRYISVENVSAVENVPSISVHLAVLWKDGLNLHVVKKKVHLVSTSGSLWAQPPTLLVTKASTF